MSNIEYLVRPHQLLLRSQPARTANISAKASIRAGGCLCGNRIRAGCGSAHHRPRQVGAEPSSRILSSFEVLTPEQINGKHGTKRTPGQ